MNFSCCDQNIEQRIQDQIKTRDIKQIQSEANKFFVRITDRYWTTYNKSHSEEIGYREKKNSDERR